MAKSDLSMLKNILIAGIPAGLFLVFISAITESAGFIAYVSNIAVNITDWMISVIFYNFMIGIILVLVYNAMHKGLDGDNPLTKGLLFGILVWMLQTLPNIINMFLHNPQYLEFLKLELITGFVSYPLVGVVIAFTYSRYIERKT